MSPERVPTARQKEVAKLVTRFESGFKKEDPVKHRGASVLWKSVADRLETSRAEMRGSEGTFPGGMKKSGHTPRVDSVIDQLPSDLVTTTCLGESGNVLVEKNTAKSQEWEDELRDQADDLDLSDKENHYLTKPLPSQSRRIHIETNALTLRRDITEASLALHETTQFPLEVAKIPKTRNRYTMFASPPKTKGSPIQRNTPPFQSSAWGAPSSPAPKVPLPPIPQRQPGRAIQGHSSNADPRKPSRTLALRAKVFNQGSKWGPSGPSGPPPDQPLPYLPPEVAKQAKMERMKDQVRNRELRAQEMGERLMKEVTACDLAFGGKEKKRASLV